MNEVKIDLKEPVEFDGKTYESLTLHKFKAKHFKALPSKFWDMVSELQEEDENKSANGMKLAIDMMPLVAALSNVPEEVIDELSVSDLMKVSAELGPFLEGSLKIGEE